MCMVTGHDVTSNKKFSASTDYITGLMTNSPKAVIMEVQRSEEGCNYGTCNR